MPDIMDASIGREQILEDIAIIRWGFIPKGQKVPGHAHNYPHVTFFLTGGVHCRYWKPKPEGGFTLIREEDIWAPRPKDTSPIQVWRLIKADYHHEFTGLEDCHYVCSFAFRDPATGETVQTWNGNMAAAGAK